MFDARFVELIEVVLAEFFVALTGFENVVGAVGGVCGRWRRWRASSPMTRLQASVFVFEVKLPFLLRAATAASTRMDWRWTLPLRTGSRRRLSALRVVTGARPAQPPLDGRRFEDGHVCTDLAMRVAATVCWTPGISIRRCIGSRSGSQALVDARLNRWIWASRESSTDRCVICGRKRWCSPGSVHRARGQRVPLFLHRAARGSARAWGQESTCGQRTKHGQARTPKTSEATRPSLRLQRSSRFWVRLRCRRRRYGSTLGPQQVAQLTQVRRRHSGRIIGDALRWRATAHRVVNSLSPRHNRSDDVRCRRSAFRDGSFLHCID